MCFLDKYDKIKHYFTRCFELENRHHPAPHLKRMDLLKNVINMNLLLFNNKFLVLNEVFDISNF